MGNLMDNTPFNNVPFNGTTPQTIETLIQQIKQNPAAFEEQMRRGNPQAYNMALQIRNSPNPRAAILQLMQAKGFNPSILNMLGLV